MRIKLVIFSVSWNSLSELSEAEILRKDTSLVSFLIPDKKVKIMDLKLRWNIRATITDSLEILGSSYTVPFLSAFQMKMVLQNQLPLPRAAGTEQIYIGNSSREDKEGLFAVIYEASQGWDYILFCTFYFL